ncbi:hypothetical protein D3C80_129230 [compost metagenome]
MAAVDQLNALLGVIGSIGGKEQTTTTSGGTTTQQTQLSDEAVQARIQQILRGPGGVRDIGNSARRAGLYNSTSEDLLLGNLYAQAAAQGEIARAPVVTTTAPQTQTTETPGVNAGTALATIGGAAILNQVIGAVGNQAAGGIGNLIGNFFGGDDDSLDIPGVATSFGVGPDSSIGVTGSVTEGTGPGGFSGNAFGAQLGQGLPGISGESVGASGLGIGAGDDEGFDLVGSVGNALSGFFSGGGLGGLVGAITGGTGAIQGGGGGGGTRGGSIICTALIERGELDESLYQAGEKYLAKVSPLTKVGYYYWAEGVADKIRNGSRLATILCRPLARGRTSLLASSGSFWQHLRHPLGTLTKFVGEPACWCIGAVVMVGKFHRTVLVR